MAHKNERNVFGTIDHIKLKDYIFAKFLCQQPAMRYFINQQQ